LLLMWFQVVVVYTTTPSRLLGPNVELARLPRVGTSHIRVW